MSEAAVRALRFCRADELGEGEVRSRELGGLPVAVARQDGRLHAFFALCPHQHYDLSEGYLERGGIACPQHLWRFEFDTGACRMVPGARIPVYAAREVDGWIVVELPAAEAGR